MEREDFIDQYVDLFFDMNYRGNYDVSVITDIITQMYDFDPIYLDGVSREDFSYDVNYEYDMEMEKLDKIMDRCRGENF